MDGLVETVIEDNRWAAFGLGPLAARVAGTALEEIGLTRAGFQIGLLGCDDARIAVLNTAFRGKPVPTNVLSWPSEERAAPVAGGAPNRPRAGTADEPETLGDLAIAWETCVAEAEAQGKLMVDHVTHLILHGLLHLLGYDHVEEADAALMEGHEVRILATLGVSDPY